MKNFSLPRQGLKGSRRGFRQRRGDCGGGDGAARVESVGVELNVLFAVLKIAGNESRHNFPSCLVLSD
jgi:hypothetical protein